MEELRPGLILETSLLDLLNAGMGSLHTNTSNFDYHTFLKPSPHNYNYLSFPFSFYEYRSWRVYRHGFDFLYPEIKLLPPLYFLICMSFWR